MKGRNIRKEKFKKPTRQPVRLSKSKIMTDADYGIVYRITYDNYEAEVRLNDTGELVGVYKAAVRNWRNIQYTDFLTPRIRIKVESLYA